MPPKPLRKMRDRHFVPYVQTKHWLKAFCIAHNGLHACGITYDLFPPPKGYKPKNTGRRTYYVSEPSMLKDWRTLVLEKDGCKCKICGSSASLDAHHIYPNSWFPHMRFVVDNGITLCSRCHNIVHNEDGELLKHTITPDEFLNLTRNITLINKHIEDSNFWGHYTGLRDRARLYIYKLQDQIPMFEGRNIEKEIAEFKLITEYE